MRLPKSNEVMLKLVSQHAPPPPDKITNKEHFNSYLPQSVIKVDLAVRLDLTASDACTSKSCVWNDMSKKVESAELKNISFSKTHVKRSMLLHHSMRLFLSLFHKINTNILFNIVHTHFCAFSGIPF